jgi:hypothetical protein
MFAANSPSRQTFPIFSKTMVTTALPYGKLDKKQSRPSITFAKLSPAVQPSRRVRRCTLAQRLGDSVPILLSKPPERTPYLRGAFSSRSETKNVNAAACQFYAAGLRAGRDPLVPLS